MYSNQRSWINFYDCCKEFKIYRNKGVKTLPNIYDGELIAKIIFWQRTPS